MRKKKNSHRLNLRMFNAAMAAFKYGKPHLVEIEIEIEGKR